MGTVDSGARRTPAPTCQVLVTTCHLPYLSAPPLPTAKVPSLTWPSPHPYLLDPPPYLLTPLPTCWAPPRYLPAPPLSLPAGPLPYAPPTTCWPLPLPDCPFPYLLASLPTNWVAFPPLPVFCLTCRPLPHLLGPPLPVPPPLACPPPTS